MDKSNIRLLQSQESGVDLSNKVLDQAKDQFDAVIVIGWDSENYLDALSTANLNKSDCLYLIELFKKGLIDSA